MTSGLPPLTGTLRMDRPSAVACAKTMPPAPHVRPVGGFAGHNVTAPPPLNAMRVGLHPRGLARWIVNLGEVRAYFLGRLERQVALTGDPKLASLLDDVARCPGPDHERNPATEAAAQILTPTMRMRTPDGRELAFFATVATFGAAAEVTTSELSIELAFPADTATADALKNLAGDG